MHLKSIIFALFVCWVGVGGSQLFAQDQEAIAAKYYHPSSNPGLFETRDKAIDWQVERLMRLHARYQQDSNRLSKVCDQCNRTLDDITNSLALEIRFLDSFERSKLVGRTVEELLNSKLDLATQESILAETKQGAEEIRLSDELTKAEISNKEMVIVAANKKLEVAKIELDKVVKLAASGSKSRSEEIMASYTHEIAQLEVQKAIRDLNVGMSEAKLRKLRQSSDLRVKIQPLKSRIAAAESFLEKFADADKKQSQIESIKRKLRELTSRKQSVDEQLTKVTRELDELQVLKDMMNDYRKNNNKKDETK